MVHNSGMTFSDMTDRPDGGARSLGEILRRLEASALIDRVSLAALTKEQGPSNHPSAKVRVALASLPLIERALTRALEIKIACADCCGMQVRTEDESKLMTSEELEAEFSRTALDMVPCYMGLGIFQTIKIAVGEIDREGHEEVTKLDRSSAFRHPHFRLNFALQLRPNVANVPLEQKLEQVLLNGFMTGLRVVWHILEVAPIVYQKERGREMSRNEIEEIFSSSRALVQTLAQTHVSLLSTLTKSHVGIGFVKPRPEAYILTEDKKRHLALEFDPQVVERALADLEVR
ncbi:MAG: hypothetical protein KDD53_05740, partial [Bdellovibrionales bacterium]|nr:hypothetical protein [Bdellovibrionales bacterium]